MLETALVETKNISKSFGSTQALKDVYFELKAGEIHALLGENGAGKSTMMKILAGVYIQDSGEIFLGGKKVVYKTPKEALDLGISIIYQELNLCSHLSVMQNVFLNREIKKNGILDTKAQIKRCNYILQQLQLELNPSTLVKDLSIAKKQLVEIAKAISTNCKILIMDEPTSSLSEKEIENLFAVMKDLRSKGYGIIYISHRLEELHKIADRITIFRDGQFITTKELEECTIDEIVTYMAGREISKKYPKIWCEIEEKLVEVKNISKLGIFENVSLDVYKGEILGIAGLVGSGRTEIAKGIFGVYGKIDGEIFIQGKKVKISTPEQAVNVGIAYIPEDRKLEGLAINMKIYENITIPSSKELSNFGVLNYKKIRNLTKNSIDMLKIKTTSIYQRARELSGGNQQKVVIAKWLAKNPKLLIFDEPTRGIDVSAKVYIYELLQELKTKGIAIIVISSELQELFGITDRIAVVSGGKITGIVQTNQTSQEEIIQLATN